MQEKMNTEYDKKREIIPMGTILEVDEEGFLIGQSSAEKLHSPWKEAVEDIRDAYVDCLGERLHSVYVRGSVSRGTPVEGISDIDTVAFINGSPDEIEEIDEWISSMQQELQEKHPFCTKVELDVRPVEGILTGKNIVGRAMVKINSVCVYGKDLAPELPKVKPGRGMYSMVWRFDQDIHRRIERIKSGEIKLSDNQCRWIMKRILRAGMELVMEQEQAFTRDLYPCYEMFSKYYPEREREMYRALELSINSSTNQSEVLGLAGDLGYWLGTEIKEKLGIPKEEV